MLTLDESGLFCAEGGFHVDPTKPVARAVFTGEHKKVAGCGEVFEPANARGERRQGSVIVSFHPSGFAPGAAQVRIQGAEVWVVTGDWKRARDPLCASFEPVPCDVLVTPAHFALPIFRWSEPALVSAWLDEQESAILFASPVLALRLHAELGRKLRRHEDLEPLARRWEELGAKLPESDPSSKHVLAPLALRSSVKIRGAKTALVAGSTRIRGTRRRSNHDTGFALSEHADWPAILRTIEETHARRVLVREGYGEPLARYLRESGLESAVL